VLLHSAQARRAYECITIFFRETLRDLNLESDRLNHAADRTVIDPLDDADAFGWEVALSAKAQNIKPGAGANGGEKNFERAGGGGSGGLVRLHSEGSKMGVHTGTAGEVDNHFHNNISPNIQIHCRFNFIFDDPIAIK